MKLGKIPSAATLIVSIIGSVGEYSLLSSVAKMVSFGALLTKREERGRFRLLV
ncbi:MAG: hypothetical protein PVF15_06195 [Candidatus Bathyarchaeota archaeon]|jgi:hypothetical protein